MGSDTPQKAFLRSRANSIEGGTTEVMKNILGERVLGLPGDVRVDRERPVVRKCRAAERCLAAERAAPGVAAADQAESAASTSLAPTLRSSMPGRSSRLPPSITVDAVSIAFWRSRMLRGGGKYSSSSVMLTTSTPSDGSRNSMTAATSSSGADAPAVTPTTPVRSFGQLVDAVDPEHACAPGRDGRAVRALACSTSSPSRARRSRHIGRRAPSAPPAGSWWRSRGRCAPASTRRGIAA